MKCIKRKYIKILTLGFGPTKFKTNCTVRNLVGIIHIYSSVHEYYQPHHLPSELLIAVHSCSRHGVIAAKLTSKCPGGPTFLAQNIFLCCEYVHKFSHWASC
jgi:hypothetical protein